jgi:hypothetical protein
MNEYHQCPPTVVVVTVDSYVTLLFPGRETTFDNGVGRLTVSPGNEPEELDEPDEPEEPDDDELE